MHKGLQLVTSTIKSFMYVDVANIIERDRKRERKRFTHCKFFVDMELFFKLQLE